MKEARGSWYLITGLFIGVVIGLLTAWLLVPVEFVNTSPATLRADFKNEYRYLIANAYAATGNLGRAKARLNLLQDTDSAAALINQAQALSAAGASIESVQVLEGLANILNTSPQPNQLNATPFPTLESASNNLTSSPTSLPIDNNALTPTVTHLPSSTPTFAFTVTPKPTRTPTATPGSPFALVRQSTFCRVNQPGLLQIWLTDSAGQPAAGIEITITWANGQDTFFTGLKPEINNGYADYHLSNDIEYAVGLSGGNTRITGIRTGQCKDDSIGNYAGGVELIFNQP